MHWPPRTGRLTSVNITGAVLAPIFSIRRRAGIGR